MRTKFKKWAVDYLDESFTNQIKLDKSIAISEVICYNVRVNNNK